MDNQTYFIKIRVGLVLNPNIDVTSNGIDGRPSFTQEFKEKLYEYEEAFRVKIIIPINELIGTHNWAIKFIQHPTEKPTFFADIYTDNLNDYSKIVSLIKNSIDNIEFSYYYKGTINDYISR